MSTLTAPGSPQAPSLGKSLRRVALATLAILAIPFAAMCVSDEVNWGPGDFIIAAVLLGGTGLLLEFGARKCATRRSRVMAGGVIVLALLLVWAELAVGMVGSPFAGS